MKTIASLINTKLKEAEDSKTYKNKGMMERI